ncbi:MAG: hypothetical protein K8R99_02055 [Actinomycetia bacterium]|nr:hypothetical protein [Actinomycetes bacterium]
MSLIHRRAVSLITLVLAACFGFASIVSADTATLAPASGTSAIDGSGLRDTALDTAFNLTLAPGAHCTGNAAGGYQVRSYFIGSGVTLSSVDFGPLGLPLPQSGTGSGTTFISTLPNFSGSAFTLNPGTSAPFLVTGLPQLSLYRMVNKVAIPNGTYHMGIACVDSTNHVDGANFWDTAIVISGQSATSMGWALDTATTTTTTTTSTTSTSTTTTTTVGGSSTTTTSTTSTVAGGSTTSTTRPTTTSTTIPTGTIPRTGGSSSTPFLALALLTLLIGRVVLLVSRPVRVLPPS